MELYEQYPLVKAMFAGFPGVRGVGIGTKETAGRLTGHIAWRIYVKEKIAWQDLPAEYRIPSHLFNIHTDVITAAQVFPNCGDNGYKATLTPGIQIANDSGAEGTLGCFARLRSNSSTVILGNHHILYANGRGANANLGQPSVSCSSCNNCGTVARNIGNGSNGLGPTTTENINGTIYTVGTMDCGVASLIPNVRPYTNNIPGIGMITGTPPSGQLGVAISASGNLSNPDAASLVRKVGIETGLTLGQVVVLDSPVNGPIYDEDSPVHTAFIHQMLIMPRQSRTTVGRGINFCDGGDSGAVVVNEANQVIGLLRGMTTLPDAMLIAAGLPTGLGKFGVVTPIQRVLDQLNIDIPANYASTGTTAGTPITVPSNNYDLISPSISFKRVKSELSTTPEGAEIAAVIEKHIPEISRLVNHCRPVTVTWHRNAGPGWAVHFINSIKDDNYIIPNTVKNITRYDLLTRMSAILTEHGGETLQHDLIRYNHMIPIIAALGSVRSPLFVAPGDNPGDVFVAPGDNPGDVFVAPDDNPGNAFVTPGDNPGNAFVTPDDNPGNAFVTPDDNPGNAFVTPDSNPGTHS